MIQDTDAADLLHLHRIHPLPTDGLQDVADRSRFLQGSLEKIWQEMDKGRIRWKLSERKVRALPAKGIY